MNTLNDILASRWKRLGGSLLDGLIMLVIIIPAWFPVGVFENIERGEELSLGQDLFLLIFGLLVYLAVNGVLLAKYGQTVGKKIVGTQIVDSETKQIVSVWKVFGLRLVPVHLISQIPFAGGWVGFANALFIFRKDKRCIHDLIAGTIVVDLNKISNQNMEPIATTPADEVEPQSTQAHV